MGNETLDRITRIVVDHLGIAPGNVTPAASFVDDLDADSLDKVELIMAFEEEFQMEIPESAAEKIQTVGDAIDFVEGRRKISSG